MKPPYVSIIPGMTDAVPNHLNSGMVLFLLRERGGNSSHFF